MIDTLSASREISKELKFPFRFCERLFFLFYNYEKFQPKTKYFVVVMKCKSSTIRATKAFCTSTIVCVQATSVSDTLLTVSR